MRITMKVRDCIDMEKMGGRRWLTICRASKLSHSLPVHSLPPVFILLLSLSLSLRPPGVLVALSCCDSHLLGKRLIFSLGRESPACPLPLQTGICDAADCTGGLILGLYFMLLTCIHYPKKLWLQCPLLDPFIIYRYTNTYSYFGNVGMFGLEAPVTQVTS